MRDKYKLTEELIKQFPQGLDAKVVYSLWWHNIRAGGGMRLTNLGFKTFTDDFKLEHYTYSIDPFTINNRTIITLDRKLNNPWFLIINKQMPEKLVFFSSKEAMLFNLYGDLSKFLDNYN